MIELGRSKSDQEGKGAVIAVPFVFYLAMWIGYDVVGLSEILPGFMVPAGSKGQLAQNQGPWTAPASTIPSTPSTEPDASSQASGEHTVARPALPGEEPPPETDMPADEPPALGPNSTAPPADETPTPSADAAESDSAKEAGADEPAADPFAPAVAPQDAPEPAADAPADDDPFGQPKSPESPPAEAEPADSPFAPDNAAEKMPEEGADAAADDDPFRRPSSPELPGTEPAPEAPAEPEPKPESPAGDADPFGTPATDSKPAPADDLFSPAPDAKPAEDEPAEPSAPTDSEALPSPDEPAQPVQPLGPRNFAQVTPAEVAGAMQATMTAGQQMAAAEDAGDAAQLNKARASFYVSLFDMANAITLGQLGPAAAQLDPQLRALEPMIRQQLAADPKRFELLKIFGARWFAFPRRTTNGVVLAGTVESVDQIGKLFHTKLKSGPDAGAKAVTVVSVNDPQLEVGNEVMTFGSIVEEPADQLVGYEGGEPAVVWSGMTLKISLPAN